MVEQSPIFAGRLGARTTDGIEAVATQAIAVLKDDDIGVPTLEGKFEDESTEIRQGGVVVGHTLEPIGITGVRGDEICIGTVHGIAGRLSAPEHVFQQQFEYAGRLIQIWKVGEMSAMVPGLAGSRITDVVAKILA